jgi:hypothetical protein
MILTPCSLLSIGVPAELEITGCEEWRVLVRKAEGYRREKDIKWILSSMGGSGLDSF